jgi:hypothetical protein
MNVEINTPEEREEVKRYILTVLAVELADDGDFLDRVNKLTFGLLKQGNLR